MVPDGSQPREKTSASHKAYLRFFLTYQKRENCMFNMVPTEIDVERARRSEAGRKAAETRKANAERARLEREARVDRYWDNPDSGAISEKLNAVAGNFRQGFEEWMDKQVDDAIAQVNAIGQQYGSESVVAAFESGDAASKLKVYSFDSFDLGKFFADLLKSHEV
jgi:hypothetical protein